MQQQPLALLVLLAVATCSEALAPESSQWAAGRGANWARARQRWAFVAPQLQHAALGARAGQQRAGVGNARPSAGRGGVGRSLLRMTDTRKTENPVEDARTAACRAIRSTLAAAGMPVDTRDEQVESSNAKVDEFVVEVGRQVNTWVKDLQSIDEDTKVAEIRDSLDAVSDQLNRGSSLQWSKRATAADRVMTWRAIRKQTDPSTKNLLISIERIRRQYEQGVYQMTGKVRPWTQEEIDDAVQSVTDSLTGEANSLSQISADLESTTESITDTIKPFSAEEVEAFTSEIDIRWKYGVQAAEEELRAGLERARYHLRRRTKFRTVEEEAAALSWRDGSLYATPRGKPAVQILEGMSPEIYIDDIDDVHAFLGMQSAEELAQHVVRLGSFPASAGRWLSCARQKLWWMSPDVGEPSEAIPAESQFVLYDAGQGVYVVMLPLVGNTFRSALWGEPDGAIDLHIESGDPALKCRTCATSVLVAAGSDPYKLLERAFAAAADRLGSFRVREEKPLPPSLEVFGWCTWDAFYSQVEPEGIKAGLEELIRGGTPSRLLILDDGWQSTDNLAAYRLPQEDDVRGEVSAAELAGGGVIEAEDFANSQLTSIKDVPVRLLTWWYLNVVEKSDYDSVPVRVWRWLTYNVIRNDLMKYFAEATDWSKRLTELTPNGKFKQLGALIRLLKSDYGLQYTYCWHALTGYWLGVDPSAPGMKKFKPVIQYASNHYGYTPGILRVEPTMAWNPSSFEGVGIIPPETIRDFFGELHSSLKDAGVDGIKCDAQAAITQMGVGYGGGPKITRTYVHAMEDSAKEHLDGNCINCMCHPTENIYAFRSTSVARASDDFYPREPASHTVHVINVAYNSLFLGEVVHPDWDMFQSQHVAAKLHAHARAVGGCAVYTSDRPKVHDFDLLRKLVLPDGSVLRARLPGRPTRDSLFLDVARDGKSALKIWNRNRVGGVLGLFNLQGAWWDRSVRNFATLQDGRVPTVKALVKASDVEGLVSEVGRYALWSCEEQHLRIVDAEESVVFTLEPRDSEVVTVSALQRLPEVKDSSGQEAVWAPIGLRKMLNGGAGILSVRTLRGGVRQLNELLQQLAPERLTKQPDAGPKLATEILEEVRTLLLMLADVEEAGGEGGEAMSRHLWGEVKGLDLGPLQKFIDLNLGKGKLSSDAESTLEEIAKSTTTLTRRLASINPSSSASSISWQSPEWLSPGARKRRRWGEGEDEAATPAPMPTVRAVLQVRGQGELLIYSSARPRSVTARKMVRRKSVEESAAQALAEVVGASAGTRAGRGPEEDADARGVAPGSAQEPPYVGGGSWVRPARWVERGEAQEWPFEYSDKGGELVLQLPAMSSQDLDSGRWSLTFTWPLSPERS